MKQKTSIFLHKPVCARHADNHTDRTLRTFLHGARAAPRLAAVTRANPAPRGAVRIRRRSRLMREVHSGSCGVAIASELPPEILHQTLESVCANWCKIEPKCTATERRRAATLRRGCASAEVGSGALPIRMVLGGCCLR